VSALLALYGLVQGGPCAYSFSGPTIAALTQTPRMTVNYWLRAGRYGHPYRIGRIVYVDLAEVERAEGLKFSEHQLDHATAGLPDRILMVREQKEATDGAAQA